MRLFIFILFVVCAIGCVIALIFLPLWLDRVIVTMMRACRIYAYPLAIRLAYSLETHGDEWKLDSNVVQHQTIGRISFREGFTEAGSIRVHLPDTNQTCDQVWWPNWIERRIIHDGVMILVMSRRGALLDRILPRLPW